MLLKRRDTAVHILLLPAKRLCKSSNGPRSTHPIKHFDAAGKPSEAKAKHIVDKPDFDHTVCAAAHEAGVVHSASRENCASMPPKCQLAFIVCWVPDFDERVSADTGDGGSEFANRIHSGSMTIEGHRALCSLPVPYFHGTIIPPACESGGSHFTHCNHHTFVSMERHPCLSGRQIPDLDPVVVARTSDHCGIQRT